VRFERSPGGCPGGAARADLGSPRSGGSRRDLSLVQRGEPGDDHLFDPAARLAHGRAAAGLRARTESHRTGLGQRQDAGNLPTSVARTWRRCGRPCAPALPACAGNRTWPFAFLQHAGLAVQHDY
jgi:hypothetical protein